MRAFHRRIQVLASIVLFTSAWVLDTRGIDPAIEQCDSEQWQTCICESAGRCTAANLPPQPGYCWLGGSPLNCFADSEGVVFCSGPCQEWPEEDGWCDMEIPGC
jgi:hypothetical protein